jgi:hypothetical protein
MSEQQTPQKEENIADGWSEKTQTIVGITTVIMLTISSFGFGYAVCHLKNFS